MSIKKRYEYKPDFAVPPGETLRETMAYRNMSIKELSKRADITEQSIIRILDDQQPISQETAYKLEQVLGNTAQFWNDLETRYQEQILKLREREKLAKNFNWLKRIPIKELIKRKLIKPCEDEIELLKEVLRFYGVVSVEAWMKIWQVPQVATRRSACFETNLEAASAWIREGELKAQDIDTRPYNKSEFRNTLTQIKKMTRQLSDNFAKEMIELLAQCGVALVFVKEMPKVPWNGATKWLKPDKAMIILSLRGKRDDILWFSFFHEACHVLNHSKTYLFINNDSNCHDPIEEEANRFAADFLIPESYHNKIINAKSEEDIIKISDELGLSTGIVAGRYQYLMKDWSKFNNLKRKITWKV